MAEQLVVQNKALEERAAVLKRADVAGTSEREKLAEMLRRAQQELSGVHRSASCDWDNELELLFLAAAKKRRTAHSSACSLFGLLPAVDG